MTRAPLDTVFRHIRGLVAAAGRDESDARLLSAFARDRDEAAFAALVRRHGRLVLGVCRNVLPQAEDAEDAFQATFLVLARKADTIRKREALASWLHGVAYRIAMSARRDAARRRIHERQPTTPRPAASPAGELALRELQAVLDEEVQRLPASYRACFVLCCLQGKGKAEAARELGWKEGTVSGRLARARALLQQRLRRRGVALSAALCATAVAQPGVAAAVPARLVAPAAQAAVRFACGESVATAVSARAVGLAGHALRTFLAPRLGLAALAVAALTTVAAGFGLVAARPDADPAEPPANAQRQPPDQAAVDADGDPLPAGALARFGTARLRHGGPVLAAAFSPTEHLLATGGGDWALRLWDPATGKLVRQCHNIGGTVWTLAFAPDGRSLAGSVEMAGVRTARLWDARTGQELRKLEGAADRVNSVSFSADGKTLAGGTQGGQVLLWDVATGKKVRQFVAHEGAALAVAFAPKGLTLATGGHDRVVALWDAATGQNVRRLGGHGGDVAGVAFAPDGATLASAGQDQAVRLWRVADGRELHAIRGKAGPLRCVAFSADGKTVAAGGQNNALWLWDAATGREVRQIPAHRYEVFAVTFSADGKYLASACWDHRAHVWDLAAGRETTPRRGHEAQAVTLDFSPDGKRLVTGGHDDSVILWDVATRREIRRAEGLGGMVFSVQFAPDGRTFASGSWDGTARLFDGTTGQELRRFQGHQSGVRAVAFSPDGKTLATGGYDRTIRLWEVGTGRELRQWSGPPQMVNHLFFLPDGHTVVSAHADRSVCVWSADTGAQLHHLAGAADARVTATVSPDGRTIATRSEDGTLHLWETATGQERGRSVGKEGMICLAFAPDGRRLVWGSSGTGIGIWDAPDGRLVNRFTGHTGWVQAFAFTPDGTRMASAGADSTVLLWDWPRQMKDRPRPVRQLTAERLAAHLAALEAEDAAKAYDAVWALAAAGNQALPDLQQRLLKASPVDEKRVARLIAQLDDDAFVVRDRATTELAKLGPAVEGQLRKALADSPSAEVHQRLTRLVNQLQNSTASPERFRASRLLEVLEHVATPEARQVLETVARKAPSAAVADEARRSAQRVARRRTATR